MITVIFKGVQEPDKLCTMLDIATTNRVIKKVYNNLGNLVVVIDGISAGDAYEALYNIAESQNIDPKTLIITNGNLFDINTLK